MAYRRFDQLMSISQVSPTVNTSFLFVVRYQRDLVSAKIRPVKLVEIEE
jgi:hypothetical protein